MKLREQIKYLRKSRGLKQKQLAKMSGISFDLYTKFESGARNLSYLNLEKVLENLNGTLTVVPFRFQDTKKESEYVADDHGPNGTKMSEALESVKMLFEELPNLLNKDHIVEQSITAMEMYLTGVIGRHALAGYRKSCAERWHFYNERENGGKLGFEEKTQSLEMIVIQILKKGCDIKEFHEVPELINKLLEE